MEAARRQVRPLAGHAFEEALAAVALLIADFEWPSAVIGGIAVIAHGFARATADIDVAIVAMPDDVVEILRVARARGFRPRVEGAETFARQNLVLLLEHVSTGVPIDLSFALQGFEKEATEHAVVRRLGAVDVRVPQLTALLIYKMVAARPKDIDVVRALLSTGARFNSKAVEEALAEFDALLDTDRAGDFRRLARR